MRRTAAAQIGLAVQCAPAGSGAIGIGLVKIDQLRRDDSCSGMLLMMAFKSCGHDGIPGDYLIITTAHGMQVAPTSTRHGLLMLMPLSTPPARWPLPAPLPSPPEHL